MSRSMLEQGRAAYAYEQVRDFMSSKPETVSKEYRSYLKKNAGHGSNEWFR